MLDDIERGALLHDIGKVAMPDSLIHKAGMLTEEELAVIRTHPQVGHDILMAVPFLRTAARSSSPRTSGWTAPGYPLGLKGDEIPLGARITSVGRRLRRADAGADLPRPGARSTARTRSSCAARAGSSIPTSSAPGCGLAAPTRVPGRPELTLARAPPAVRIRSRSAGS